MIAIFLVLCIAPPQQDLGGRQERLAEQYKAFDARLRSAADTLRTIDPQRSAILSEAAGRSRTRLIERQLERIGKLLQETDKAGPADAEALAKAVREQLAVLAELDGVLAVLLSDDQAKLAKEKEERILRRLQSLRELERDQRDLRSTTDRAKNDADARRLSEPQRDLADRAKKMEADDPAGESPPQKKEPRGLEEARQAMEKAKKSLDDSKVKEAKAKQNEALEKLAKEADALAKVLRQMREEERLQSLVSLESRCRKLLDGEKALQEKIVSFDRSASKERTRAETLIATDLAGVQRKILEETNSTLTFVREDNVAVAFDEALVIARDDMSRIERRLRDADTGPVVQALTASVAAVLEDMSTSLQREIAETRERQSQEDGGGGEAHDQLLDRCAELRLVKSLQVQIEKRTALAASLAKAGESAEESAKALRELAERQHRVYEIAREIGLREKKK
jgi:hypothetical protein